MQMLGQLTLLKDEIEMSVNGLFFWCDKVQAIAPLVAVCLTNGAIMFSLWYTFAFIIIFFKFQFD